MNIPATTGAPSIQVIRLPQVCEITGLCRSAIYQLEAEQKFPRRVHLGRRSVGWIAEEVQMWLANRIELSRGSSSPPLKIFTKASELVATRNNGSGIGKFGT